MTNIGLIKKDNHGNNVIIHFPQLCHYVERVLCGPFFCPGFCLSGHIPKTFQLHVTQLSKSKLTHLLLHCFSVCTLWTGFEVW